jgi:hypothetical protein
MTSRTGRNFRNIKIVGLTFPKYGGSLKFTVVLYIRAITRDHRF